MGVHKDVFLSAPESSLFDRVPWLLVYLIISVILQIFEEYLTWRQVRRCKRKLIAAIAELQQCNKQQQLQSLQEQQQPSEQQQEQGSASTVPKREDAVTPEYEPEQAVKTNKYMCEKLTFGIVESLFDSWISLLTVALFIGPKIWRFAGRYVNQSSPYSEYQQSLIVFAIQFVVKEVLHTPFQLYSDFVVEERHGFNKKTLSLFIKDKLIGYALAIVIGAPLLCAAIALMNWGGRNLYLWLWSFSVVITFLLMGIYPNLIAPLFNKYEPVKDEELRDQIYAVAKKLKFPLGKLYQIDGSKRSSHSNAYFYGLWRVKQIVLFDTLLHLKHNQILAILCHEMGHWKKSHTAKGIVISFAQLFLVFYLFGLVIKNDHLYNEFGYTDTRAPIVGLSLFSHIFMPCNTVFALLMTMWSRKNEYEADAFAYQLGYGEPLKSGLLAIYKENKSDPDPDPLYSWWNNSHPSLVERLNALDKLENEKKHA